MKVIAIGSYKGGTGKTTTAVNLAYNLAVMGKRVLVVDADPQANATYMLSTVGGSSRTLADVFQGINLKSCIRRTKFRNLKLDIIKGDSEIEECVDNPGALKDGLHSVGEDYDYCIIDTHPSMQLPTIASMIAADVLLIPFKPDGYGKAGLTILDDYIAQIRGSFNPNLQYYVFISQYAGCKSQAAMITELAEQYNFPICSTMIRSREAVNTSIQMRHPLLMHRKSNAVTQDYLDLTNEILEMR